MPCFLIHAKRCMHIILITVKICHYFKYVWGDMTPCGLVNIYRLYVFDISIFSVQAVQEDSTTRTVKTQAVKHSESSLNYFLSHTATQSGNLNLHHHRCNNLRSHHFLRPSNTKCKALQLQTQFHSICS